MNTLPSKCPICSGNITITRLHCDDCDVTIEGRFSPSSGPFAGLSPEQQQFLLTFVKCEGKLNRMEDELNLSYPTLRSRLQEVVRTLGFEPGKDEPTTQTMPGPRVSDEDRRRILDDLDNGRISSEQAMKMLAGKSI